MHLMHVHVPLYGISIVACTDHAVISYSHSVAMLLACLALSPYLVSTWDRHNAYVREETIKEIHDQFNMVPGAIHLSKKMRR